MNVTHNLIDGIGSASFQLALAAGLAWLICTTVARNAPAIKHAIWVVVLIKCFVPPSTTAPWSVAQLWTTPRAILPQPISSRADSGGSEMFDHPVFEPAVALGPVHETSGAGDAREFARDTQPERVADRATAADGVPVAGTLVEAEARGATALETTVLETAALEAAASKVTAAEAFRGWWLARVSLASVLLVWISGGLLVIAVAVVSVARIGRQVRRGESIDEGPAVIAAEEAALALGLACPPRLVSTSESVTPFVVGLWNPTVVLPNSILGSLPDDELRLVVWHEVVHVARRDAWTSLLQLVAVALFWFHPAVWWAAAAVRREREACCDQTVLRTSRAEPSTYGDAFLHVLSAVRGRAISAPAWAAPAGVFERDSDLRTRVEQIMSFRPGRSRRVLATIATGLFALVVVPMGATGGDPWQGVAEADIPRVVSISPSSGLTDVDPSTNAIVVTFDREMSSGFSWTGAGPTFPKVPANSKPTWSDDGRTCTLPVDLEAATFYRLGLNSRSLRRFQSVDGVPIKPVVLTFTTRGANAATVGRMEAPKVVSIVPANGATDVHPLTTPEIRVTFDRPMGEGMSWVGGDDAFPPTASDAKARWLANSRTCVMPVDLEHGREYRLRLNSDRFRGFQSTAGVPLEPMEYAFRTVADNEDAIVLRDGFEKPHRDPNFVEYWHVVRTSEEVASGTYAIKLTRLEDPRVFDLTPDAAAELKATITQTGTHYAWGDPLPIPAGTKTLRVSAMVKSEDVAAASLRIGFFRWTPSAKAGKEKSYFDVPPVGADADAENAYESLFIGRVSDDEPPANHGWARYERTIEVPELAELVYPQFFLEDGGTVWLDDVVIAASSEELSNDPLAVRQREYDQLVETYGPQHPLTIAAKEQLELLSGDHVESNSTKSKRADVNDDLPALTRQSDRRPASINFVKQNDDEGLLLRDRFDWIVGEAPLWEQRNVEGVVLRHCNHVGGRDGHRTCLELTKTAGGYFPIASWSHRVDHSDPSATHVQLSAAIKTVRATKAVLDVLFLDENGEWIAHQWADYIGADRAAFLKAEGRDAFRPNQTPESETVSHDWSPYYGGAVAIPGGTKAIEVSIQIYGPGTVYVDDVEVRYLTRSQEKNAARVDGGGGRGDVRKSQIVFEDFEHGDTFLGVRTTDEAAFGGERSAVLHVGQRKVQSDSEGAIAVAGFDIVIDAEPDGPPLKLTNVPFVVPKGATSLRVEAMIAATDVSAADLVIHFLDAAATSHSPTPFEARTNSTFEEVIGIRPSQTDTGSVTHDWRRYEGAVFVPRGARSFLVSARFGEGREMRIDNLRVSAVYSNDVSAGPLGLPAHNVVATPADPTPLQ